MARGELLTRGLTLRWVGAVTLGPGVLQLRFIPALGATCKPPVPGNVLGAAYPRDCCTDGPGRSEKLRGAVAPQDEPPVRVPNDGALNDGRLIGAPPPNLPELATLPRDPP